MRIQNSTFSGLRFALIITLLGTNLTSAQNHYFNFEHLSIGDGLSNSTVNCILEDSRGIMWFGTNNGLNKYNGYEFTIFKNTSENQQSGVSYDVLALMEDQQQNIWIATKRGGLDLYQRDLDQITNIVPAIDLNQVVKSLYVFCVLEDHAGNIWFGTDAGLYYLDRKANRFSHCLSDSTDTQTLSNNRIHCLLEDHQKRIWIDSSNGLNVFNQNTTSFQRFIYDPNGPIPLDVRGIYEDPAGKIWLSVYFGGLIKIDSENNCPSIFLRI